MWSFGGIFPKIQLLKKIYQNINRHLISEEQMVAEDPPDNIINYEFMFLKADHNIFKFYETFFSLDGIKEANLVEFNG